MEKVCVWGRGGGEGGGLLSELEEGSGVGVAIDEFPDHATFRGKTTNIRLDRGDRHTRRYLSSN